jgi:hypothetical protein
VSGDLFDVIPTHREMTNLTVNLTHFGTGNDNTIKATGSRRFVVFVL